MGIRFCRRVTALSLLILAGCASQETTVQTVPPPPDLQPQPIRATAAWAMATPAPVIPRAVSNNVEDIPRARPYARSASPATVSPAKMKLALKPTVTPPSEVKVMTFNLRVRTVFDGLNMWDHRRDLVVSRVRNFDPDLLGTQEGLSSQEDFLQESLPDYTFYGVGRGDGKRGGEMCGVFFRSSRFEMMDGGHFWLSHTPDKPGSRAWGAIFPRMVTWVKLR